jgi:hypothetical protein
MSASTIKVYNRALSSDKSLYSISFSLFDRELLLSAKIIT